ncbi:MAG: Uma2 family endonuclease [Ginsengibacter sp.]
MAKIVTADYELDLEVPSLKNMTDDEFFDFCVQNKNVKIERDENHQILIMAPAGNLASSQNLEIAAQLFLWNKKIKKGIAFDSSAGFYLPDGSMLNPDAAWINKQAWDGIKTEEKKKFAYIAPDFIIELMSPSDRLSQAKLKMDKWIKNGVKLGWLIDPNSEQTFIYRADGTVDKISFDKKLSGENVLPGFELDLSIIR